MSQINVNNIRAKDGVGAVGFPGGINATGVVTATSFSGNLTGNVTGNVTGNTSGTAGGLTGTPNITVGTVTGTDATFGGNLTVNGTTTTIDTVVSAVDSLQVDGNVGIGTTIATSALDVRNGIIVKDQDTTQNSANPGLQLKHNGTIYGSWRHDGRLEIGGQDTNAKITLSASGLALFKAGLAEKVNVKAQLTGANSCAITEGNVILTTTNEPGNTYPNITGVHSVLASGESFSVTIALKVNGSGTINGFHIDGQAQTVEWSGGSAPSAGSSGYDVFTFSAFKTGSGTTDYTVFGAATNYD